MRHSGPVQICRITSLYCGCGMFPMAESTEPTRHERIVFPETRIYCAPDTQFCDGRHRWSLPMLRHGGCLFRKDTASAPCFLQHKVTPIPRGVFSPGRRLCCRSIETSPRCILHNNVTNSWPPRLRWLKACLIATVPRRYIANGSEQTRSRLH
jgi:hypothetical protein